MQLFSFEGTQLLEGVLARLVDMAIDIILTDGAGRCLILKA